MWLLYSNFLLKLSSLKLSMIFTTTSIKHSSILILFKLLIVFDIFDHPIFSLKFFISFTKIFMLAQADISLYLHWKMLKVKPIQPCYMKQYFVGSFSSQLCSKVNSKPFSEVNFDCPAWRHCQTLSLRRDWGCSSIQMLSFWVCSAFVERY